MGCDRGSAVTGDISSGGIFVKADRLLPVGKRVHLYIDWPAVLDDHAALRLVVRAGFCAAIREAVPSAWPNMSFVCAPDAVNTHGPSICPGASSPGPGV